MTTTTKKTAKKQPPKKTAPTNDAEIRVRIDAKTKSRAEKFFKRHGLSTSDGIRTLLDQALRAKEMPRIPNAKTMKVIEEAAAGKNLEPVTLDDIKKALR